MCLTGFLFAFGRNKTEHLSSHSVSLSHKVIPALHPTLQVVLLRADLLVHVECQQLCEINVMCVSWQPYRKIMSSHLSVITSRLLQMCHCTADKSGFESILYISVERCRQGLSLLLKVVSERPLIFPPQKRWHWKTTEFVMCRWKHPSRFCDSKSRGK